MNCPKCKDTSLKKMVQKSKNIELDQCPSCKGIWFDDGELYDTLGERAEKNLAIPATSRLEEAIQCPRCHTGLYGFCYPGTMTMVDACKSCNGIWLDNTEWKAIKTARAAGNQITCPKCETRQPKSDTCINCGIIFAKYRPDVGAKKELLVTTAAKTVKNKNSDLDDVPGVKGKLLRFIDNAIEKLTDY